MRNILLLTLWFLGSPILGQRCVGASTDNWRDHWELAPGFTLEVDAEGFQYPASIAFVPTPGKNPKDPLYFVAEIRGKVKVVTQDRSVYTFADIANNPFNISPKKELPTGEGEMGMAGICLEPQNGYVFVTFIYYNEKGLVRNNIIRFQSNPRTFSTKALSQTAFTEVFEGYETGLAHQIGNCLVEDGLLYVGVGDGWLAHRSRQLDHMGGKILRMTLDGKPVPSNPFYVDPDVKQARNYIWAYGFRNPFTLSMVGQRLFVADNGVNIDRFLEVQKGQDYLWNGYDPSLSANAKYIWVPSRGPVQMDFCSTNNSDFPAAYRNTFFVTLLGDPEQPDRKPGIFALPYDFSRGEIPSVSAYFLKLRRGDQHLAAAAFGPGGLYFSTFGWAPGVSSSIYRISQAPTTTAAVHSFNNADELMYAKGCIGCHAIDGGPAFMGTAGPPLAVGEEMLDRLLKKVTAAEYVQSVLKRPILTSGTNFSVKAAREEVLAAQGRDRVRTWLKYYLQEPAFDKDYVPQMPNLGLSESEALLVADFLIGKEAPKLSWIKRFVGTVLPKRTSSRKYLVLYFVCGLLGGLLLRTGARQMLRGRTATPPARSHSIRLSSTR